MATPEQIQAVLADLAAGPGMLAGLVNTMPAEALDFRDPDRGGWTPREIVAHLADLEFNLHWTARVARVLYEDEPVLCAAEQDWRALEHRHRYQDPRVAMGAYTLARKHMVRELARQPPEAWARIGVHPETGPRTLLQFAQGFPRHDRKHLSRIVELVQRAAGVPRDTIADRG